MKKAVLAALAVSVPLWVGACSTTVPTQTLPEMSFAHLGTIDFNVETIEIDNKYTPSSDALRIESRFPTAPAEAIRIWALDRLKPVGEAGSGTLRIVINEASAKETDLKLETGLKAAFTAQQSNRYDLGLDIALVILDAAGKQVGFSAAKASRSLTTSEDITLNEREKKWFEMVEKTMVDLNSEMETNIRRYLAGWIR